MKWKVEVKTYNTEWHTYFPIWPVKTQEGYNVVFERVYRRWKIHMAGGKFIYKMIDNG